MAAMAATDQMWAGAPELPAVISSSVAQVAVPTPGTEQMISQCRR
jgi:hypothetical protein